MAKNKTQVILFTRWYFGNTSWSRFQTDRPFSNAKPSLNTKLGQISMECFHFSERRFPRICLNKVPIISVQHFILFTPAWLIIFQGFPHLSIIVPTYAESLGCNQSKWPWHSFSYLVDLENGQFSMMLSWWDCTDLLMIFFAFTIIYWPTWKF